MTAGEGRSLAEWLDDVRSEYWTRLANPEEPAGGTPHVLFLLGPHVFAVEAALCKGVVKRTKVARLPAALPHLLGVAGIRGEVVSATDPKILLGLPEDRGEGRGYFLVAADGPLKAALWVDRVDEVATVDPAQILPGGAPWPGAPEGVVVGQWQGRERPVHVLDGRRYLAASAVRAGEQDR